MMSAIVALDMAEEPSSANNMVREGTSGRARKTPNKPGSRGIRFGTRPAPRPALASPQARLYDGLGPSQKIARPDQSSNQPTTPKIAEGA